MAHLLYKVSNEKQHMCWLHRTAVFRIDLYVLVVCHHRDLWLFIFHKHAAIIWNNTFHFSRSCSWMPYGQLVYVHLNRQRRWWAATWNSVRLSLSSFSFRTGGQINCRMYILWSVCFIGSYRILWHKSRVLCTSHWNVLYKRVFLLFGNVKTIA